MPTVIIHAARILMRRCCRCTGSACRSDGTSSAGSLSSLVTLVPPRDLLPADALRPSSASSPPLPPSPLSPPLSPSPSSPPLLPASSSSCTLTTLSPKELTCCSSGCFRLFSDPFTATGGPVVVDIAVETRTGGRGGRALLLLVLVLLLPVTAARPATGAAVPRPRAAANGASD